MILRVKVKESIDELVKLIKSEKDGNKKDKLKLIKMVKANEVFEIQEAAQKLYRDRGTISRWLSKYRSGGLKKLLSEKKKPSGRSLEYFTEKEICLLKERLDNPEGFLSYIEIQDWVKENFKKEVPYEVVWRTVRKKLKCKLKVARPTNIKKDKAKEEAFKKTLSTS